MTGTFTELVCAIALFIAAHSIPSIRPIRSRLVRALGEGGYLGVYSMVSVSVTFWIIAAAVAVPYVEVWPMTIEAIWLTNVLMPISIWLLILGLTTANAMSIRVRPHQYDPRHPGGVAITRHPILLAIALWGIGHMAVNGGVGAVVLFGIATAFCFFGCIVLDVRRRREFGETEWRRLAGRTSVIPFAAIAAGQRSMPWRDVFGWRLLAALALYLALLSLHEPVIRVSPLPPL